MKTIPVTIKPHLIPFLFNELEGDSDAAIPERKVKLVHITRRSTMGVILLILQERITPDYDLEKITGHSIFLSVEKNLSGNKATLFRRVKNRDTLLELLPEDVAFFNEFLENIFRNTMVSFVNGFKSRDDEHQVREAIHRFMLKHNLYETNIDPESLRAEYYRAQKKKGSLQRFQFRNKNWQRFNVTP